MKNCLILWILLFGVHCQAQHLKGKVMDMQGKPIEYVSVYVSETKMGCLTSEQGEFILPLKQGTYTCTFQHLNYKTVTKTINVPQDSLLKIKMETKAILLKEVKISAKDEDKAYRIIRNAVAKSPYYRKQLLSYKATYYAKGTMKIKDVPKLAGKLLEKEAQIKKGDVYTEESVSEVTVTSEKTEQKVISKRSSYPKSLNFDAKRFGYYNIYRDASAPVTKEGVSAYRYQLMYSYNENDLLIHHIKIIPKNKNPLMYSGYIDIIDGSWHVYCVDFTENVDYGIIKAKVTIKQNYVPIEKNVWMPGNSYIAADVKMMGYNLVLNTANSIKYSDYKVNPKMYSSDPVAETQTATPKKEPVISKKSEKMATEITEIMDKEKLTTRDAIKLVDLVEAKNKEDLKNNPTPKSDSINPLEIQRHYFFIEDSSASNCDSSLWENYRTAPLSEEELNSFEQKEIRDSIAEEKKKEKLLQKKDIGIKRSKKKNKTFHFGLSLKESTLAFNTVDGIKAGIHLHADKQFEDSATSLNNGATVGYCFAAKHLFLYGFSQWNYNPRRFASLEIFGGKQSHDFYQGEKENYLYLGNTLSSLFLRDNLRRYYDRTYAGLNHKIEIFNGFQTTVRLLYEQQLPLENHSDYSFLFRKTRQYKPNIPDNAYLTNHPDYLSAQSAVLLDVSLSYTPRMFFRYSENKKVKRYAGSKYPTFTLSWQKGINKVLGSDSHFDYLELNIAQDIDLKTLTTFKYSLSAGGFPNTKSIHFSNFKHFPSNDFWIVFNSFYGGFNTMPYYEYSTKEWFIAGHAKYETPYLMLKFIPGLNKTLMTENLHFSFLSNPLTKTYLEVGYSLSKIYFVGNIGFFVGFNEFKSVNWSIQAGFSLF